MKEPSSSDEGVAEEPETEASVVRIRSFLQQAMPQADVKAQRSGLLCGCGTCVGFGIFALGVMALGDSYDRRAIQAVMIVAAVVACFCVVISLAAYRSAYKRSMKRQIIDAAKSGKHDHAAGRETPDAGDTGSAQ